MNLHPLVAVALLVCPCACAGGRAHGGSRAPAPPPSAEELFRRSEESAARGDGARAEEYAEAALARGFPEERATPLLLRVCIASRRYRSALGHVERRLSAHPADSRLRVLAAMLHLARGDAVPARRQLEIVLAEAPDDGDARYLLAVVLWEGSHDARGAARELQRYLETGAARPRAAAARLLLVELRGGAESSSRRAIAPGRSASGR